MKPWLCLILLWGFQAPACEAADSGNPPILLLVDMQHDFWGEGMAAQNPAFQKNVRSLVKTCRQAGIEVVHIHTGFSPDPKQRPAAFNTVLGSGQLLGIVGTGGAKPLPFAVPAPREKVFIKQSFGSFTNPKLVEYLKKKKPLEIYIAGLTTEMCVLTTAIGAMDHGHRARLVVDCCGSARFEATQFVVARYGFLFKPMSHLDIARQSP